RVEVRWRPADECRERVDLTRHLGGNRVSIIEVDDVHDFDPLTVSVGPVGQLDVQSDVELWQRAAELDRFASVRGSNHEARTRHDPFGVGTNDAAIDGLRSAEIVGVHDDASTGLDLAHRRYSSAASRS